MPGIALRISDKDAVSDQSGVGVLRASLPGLGGICFAAVCYALIQTEAHAGPPFRTDDPEPPEFGHYQFYTISSGTEVQNALSGNLPGFEFDYGLIPEGQLTINANAAFNRLSGGPSHSGYGDTSVSFKYRFIQEDFNGVRPQVAVFPAVNLPTGNQKDGLGAGHAAIFFPVWAQKSFGDWTTYGGGGYWINENSKTGDKNYWFSGWLLQRKITEKLFLAGEVFYQTAANIHSKESAGFNFGGGYDFDAHNHLIFSFGQGIRNAADTNEFSWYVAFEITN